MKAGTMPVFALFRRLAIGLCVFNVGQSVWGTAPFGRLGDPIGGLIAGAPIVFVGLQSILLFCVLEGDDEEILARRRQRIVLQTMLLGVLAYLFFIVQVVSEYDRIMDDAISVFWVGYQFCLIAVVMWYVKGPANFGKVEKVISFSLVVGGLALMAYSGFAGQRSAPTAFPLRLLCLIAACAMLFAYFWIKRAASEQKPSGNATNPRM